MSNGSSSSRLRPTATSRKSNVPVKRSATGKSPVRRSDVSNVRSGSRGTKKNNSSGKRTGGTLVSSLVKALIYIVFILIISGLLAVFAITRANDIFAFVKDGADMTVTITDDTTVSELGQILKENGIIKYPSMFELYSKIKKKRTVYVGGEYTVNASMSYDRLIATFARTLSTTRTTVVAVIPEGYTVKQIVNTMVNKYHLSSEEELYDAIQNYPFDFWFVKELDNLPETSKYKKDRTFRLEGYLYPDTYYYYSDASAVTIIYKMLNNFENKLKTTFGKDYRNVIDDICKKRGLTFDEMIIIASMIQMEGKYDYDFGGISSVFHNRLSNPSVTYGLLGSDATVMYIFDKRTTTLTAEQLATENPYNTRLYKGLPPGPISNPEYLAVNYSFYPDDTNYYYFVSQKNGTTLFASNWIEHQKNVELVESGIIVDPNASDEDEE